MKNKHKYFPLYVDISDMNILVIGAGKIASRRIATLTQFNDNITVVAPQIDERIRELPVTLVERCFEWKDLEDRDMVIIGTNDAALNERIAQICTHKEIMKNVISNRDLCDFYFPGIVSYEDAVIGISTGGASPKKAREMKEKIRKGLIIDDES